MTCQKILQKNHHFPAPTSKKGRTYYWIHFLNSSLENISLDHFGASSRGWSWIILWVHASNRKPTLNFEKYSGMNCPKWRYKMQPKTLKLSFLYSRNVLYDQSGCIISLWISLVVCRTTYRVMIPVMMVHVCDLFTKKNWTTTWRLRHPNASSNAISVRPPCEASRWTHQLSEVEIVHGITPVKTNMTLENPHVQ